MMAMSLANNIKDVIEKNDMNIIMQNLSQFPVHIYNVYVVSSSGICLASSSEEFLMHNLAQCHAKIWKIIESSAKNDNGCIVYLPLFDGKKYNMYWCEML